MKIAVIPGISQSGVIPELSNPGCEPWQKQVKLLLCPVLMPLPLFIFKNPCLIPHNFELLLLCLSSKAKLFAGKRKFLTLLEKFRTLKENCYDNPHKG